MVIPVEQADVSYITPVRKRLSTRTIKLTTSFTLSTISEQPDIGASAQTAIKALSVDFYGLV